MVLIFLLLLFCGAAADLADNQITIHEIKWKVVPKGPRDVLVGECVSGTYGVVYEPRSTCLLTFCTNQSQTIYGVALNSTTGVPLASYNNLFPHENSGSVSSAMALPMPGYSEAGAIWFLTSDQNLKMVYSLVGDACTGKVFVERMGIHIGSAYRLSQNWLTVDLAGDVPVLVLRMPTDVRNQTEWSALRADPTSGRINSADTLFVIDPCLEYGTYYYQENCAMAMLHPSNLIFAVVSDMTPISFTKGRVLRLTDDGKTFEYIPDDAFQLYPYFTHNTFVAAIPGTDTVLFVHGDPFKDLIFFQAWAPLTKQPVGPLISALSGGNYPYALVSNPTGDFVALAYMHDKYAKANDRTRKQDHNMDYFPYVDYAYVAVVSPMGNLLSDSVMVFNASNFDSTTSIPCFNTHKVLVFTGNNRFEMVWEESDAFVGNSFEVVAAF